ncbi:MAG: cytochrome c [Lentisphaeraceae bacterium]|nr:cytochrome c [Lentisphaeraceae bacterium]
MIKLATMILTLGLTLQAYGSSPESIRKGEQIYNAVCFACHGKNLEGGGGFNLRDTEWIHGGSPEQILATIKKGFPEKGMIPFGTLYKDEQLHDVVNFILSRQQGFKKLEYKIFHDLRAEKEMEAIAWSELKAAKSGSLKPLYLDINLPEVDWFGIQNSGVLVIPESGEYSLKGVLNQKTHFQIFIDGKPIALDIKRKAFKYVFEKKIKLLKGTKSFETRFVKIHKKANLHLQLEKGELLIPLSKEAFIETVNQKILLTATQKPLILRKRISGLPSKTIAVAFPEKINVGVNPRNASINGMWLGEFVDVGPNVFGRGGLPGKIASKFIFAGDKGLDLMIGGESPKVKYKEYSTYKNPVFLFTANGKDLSLEMIIENQVLTLTYRSQSTESISFNIPTGVRVESSHGIVSENKLMIEPKHNKEFVVKLMKKEMK